MDIDSGLAIGILVGVFGLGLLCMLTNFCKSFCIKDQQEVVLPQVQDADDYILISQEILQPQ